MIINCHKINLDIQRDIFWVPKPFILKWPYMWVLHLRLIFHLRLSKSSMDYFKWTCMQVLCVGFGFHWKATQTTYWLFRKWPYMWVLLLGLGLHLRLLESPMGYIETNLNMGIAFKARYSYNFAIPTHIFIFIN
jgi:hypothetical protein